MRVIFPVIEENQLSYSYTESTHIQKQKPVTEQVKDVTINKGSVATD